MLIKWADSARTITQRSEPQKSALSSKSSHVDFIENKHIPKLQIYFFYIYNILHNITYVLLF